MSDERQASATTAIPDGYARCIDWPCKKCKSRNVAECRESSTDGAYDDYHFICLDCRHSWWEESSDY